MNFDDPSVDMAATSFSGSSNDGDSEHFSNPSRDACIDREEESNETKHLQSTAFEMVLPALFGLLRSLLMHRYVCY